jgi:hypothetical protein
MAANGCSFAYAESPPPSAVYGFTKVSDCRDAKAELAARLNATSGDDGPPPAR